MELNKALFWDTNSDKPDEEIHKRHIPHRVSTRGDLCDIKSDIQRYGKETIKKEIVLFRKLHFLSVLFDINLEEFRCNITKPLSQEHLS